MKDHIWLTSRNKRLSAMVHFPNGFPAGTPLVICCHGFTGDKVGYNQLTRNLAEFLEITGYGVIRFDYLGSGDSEGDFAADTFIAGWAEDLRNVLAWVKKQPEFTTSPVILYGHSLGGLLVLTHKDYNKDIAARMVFAPVIYAINNFKEIILGEELWHKSIRGETIANFFDRGFRLHSQFVRDLVSTDYNPIRDASKLSTPLLIVHGTLDKVVPIQGSRDLFAAYKGEKELVELAVDHGAVGAQAQLQTIIGGWLKKYFPVRGLNNWAV